MGNHWGLGFPVGCSAWSRTPTVGAFNMIDQDRLLMVMYDLGFPTDAVQVVKDLYEVPPPAMSLTMAPPHR
jgi:hypothetical protein